MHCAHGDDRVAARVVTPSPPGSAQRQPEPHQRLDAIWRQIIHGELTALWAGPVTIVLWGGRGECAGRLRAVVNEQDVLGREFDVLVELGRGAGAYCHNEDAAAYDRQHQTTYKHDCQ